VTTTDTKTFRTDRLNLAIFLLATKALQLRGLDVVRPGGCEFIFADPDDRGAELEFSFHEGALVRAVSLFAAQVTLRRMMTEKLNQNHQNTHTQGANNNVRNNQPTR
jgi:hypothetical protein